MISESETFKQNILKNVCKANRFFLIHRITFKEQSDRLQRQSTVTSGRREQSDIIRCLQSFEP